MARPTDPRSLDAPEPGHYRFRLVRRGPLVGALIEHEAERWRVSIDGKEGAWFPNCWADPNMERVYYYGEKIDKAEYDFMLATAEHARQHDPTHPAARPYEPINLRLMPPLYRRNAR